MLVELRIKNFAIIDSLQLEFNPGLVILTGETGAGKSIIMGALEMLLGSRVDMSALRQGSDFASVEAVFKIPPTIKESLLKRLKEEEILDGTEYLTLTREMRADRPNIARVNGHRTNVALLVELGESLVDIHGQSEHLSLMKVSQHLGLLDRYANTAELLKAYQEVYSDLRQTQRELAKLRQIDLEADQRKDLLSFQIEEIELAGLQEGEEEQLAKRRNQLVNAEKLSDLCQKVLTILDDAPGNQPTVMDLVGQIVRSSNELFQIDPVLEGLAGKTAGLSDGLFELGKELRSYLDNLEFDSAELDKTQERLALIQEMKRKYGQDIPEILAYRDQARVELDEITGRNTRIDELLKIEKSLLVELGQSGQDLTRARQEGARQLSAELEDQLNDLKMAGARFDIAFRSEEDPAGVIDETGQRVKYYPDGLEKIEFLVETNPGEGLKALAKTASGGETSRLMLALKNVLAQADHISTLVFDEIDQGIGGRIGAVVGEKLYRLTPEHQVICITHLPQLAGFGQQHFQVVKSLIEGRTAIQVLEIEGEARVEELATMLGGPSEKNLASARELMAYVAEKIS
ncbi:MAG TPA: DNA repair protein RecN [Chloroflexi bacterium]|nr:MAG: DNA repair protein RecN [Chloroflexota bacterium]HDD56208.1 DNA repair protein RecN [Chloroflexota bacterium]